MQKIPQNCPHAHTEGEEQLQSPLRNKNDQLSGVWGSKCCIPWGHLPTPSPGLPWGCTATSLLCPLPPSTAVGAAEGCRGTDGIVSLQVPAATPTTTTMEVGATVAGGVGGEVRVPITKLSLCPTGTVAEAGTIAGIASGLAMALIGAVSSYISYQQKKFCFSIQRKSFPRHRGAHTQQAHSCFTLNPTAILHPVPPSWQNKAPATGHWVDRKSVV